MVRFLGTIGCLQSVSSGTTVNTLDRPNRCPEPVFSDVVDLMGGLFCIFSRVVHGYFTAVLQAAKRFCRFIGRRIGAVDSGATHEPEGFLSSISRRHDDGPRASIDFFDRACDGASHILSGEDAESS